MVSFMKNVWKHSAVFIEGDKTYNSKQYEDDWEGQINVPQKPDVSYFVLTF